MLPTKPNTKSAMKAAVEAPAEGLLLDLQIATADRLVPPRDVFEAAVRAALSRRRQRAELTIRVVGRPESRRLNKDYRQVDKATNVLSFPAGDNVGIMPHFLGDIAICAVLVHAEARAQRKPVEAHWTHLVVHGVLHLLGYDHVEEAEAKTMEDLERTILARLGLPDPYDA